MSRGHNKGSGQHRKTGDWVKLAQGLGNIRRDATWTVRCPHGDTPHFVASKGFLGHLNACKAGLARVA